MMYDWIKVIANHSPLCGLELVGDTPREAHIEVGGDPSEAWDYHWLYAFLFCRVKEVSRLYLYIYQKSGIEKLYSASCHGFQPVGRLTTLWVGDEGITTV